MSVCWLGQLFSQMDYRNSSQCSNPPQAYQYPVCFSLLSDCTWNHLFTVSWERWEQKQASSPQTINHNWLSCCPDYVHSWVDSSKNSPRKKSAPRLFPESQSQVWHQIVYEEIQLELKFHRPVQCSPRSQFILFPDDVISYSAKATLNYVLIGKCHCFFKMVYSPE